MTQGHARMMWIRETGARQRDEHGPTCSSIVGPRHPRLSHTLVGARCEPRFGVSFFVIAPPACPFVLQNLSPALNYADEDDDDGDDEQDVDVPADCVGTYEPKEPQHDEDD
jgi:hypothetical protein